MAYRDPKTGNQYPSKQWMFDNIKNLPEVQAAYPERVTGTTTAAKTTGTTGITASAETGGLSSIAQMVQQIAEQIPALTERVGALKGTAPTGGIDQSTLNDLRSRIEANKSAFESGQASRQRISDIMNRYADNNLPGGSAQWKSAIEGLMGEVLEGKAPVTPETVAEEPIYQPPADEIVEPTAPADITAAGIDLTIPESLRNDPYFMQLDPDSQAMIAYYQDIADKEDVKRQEAFDKALKLAGEAAEPYFKEKLSIIQDELSRAIGTMGADLASREQELTRRSREIEEDLTYNRENLTVDEAAELARQRRQYDIELETIGETMADRGLSSSTIRNRAESRLEESYVDVIESTGRKYARAQRAEGVGAARLQTDITQQMADLQRRTAEAKTGAARGVEQYVGTEELGKMGLGQFALGGIKGGMEEEKAGDILQRSQAMMLTNNPQFT